VSIPYIYPPDEFYWKKDLKKVMRDEIVLNYPQLAFIGAGRAEHTLWVIHSPGVEKKLNFDNFSV